MGTTELKSMGTLADIWCNVLSLESVSANDDFFALGGDSMRAILMLVRVNEEFGSMIDVDRFFASPTLEQLHLLVTAPDGG